MWQIKSQWKDTLTFSSDSMSTKVVSRRSSLVKYKIEKSSRITRVDSIGEIEEWIFDNKSSLRVVSIYKVSISL